MSFADELDQLPQEGESPGEKLRAALALYDEGVAAQRLVFERRYPGIDSQRLDELMQAWLRREGEHEAR